MSRDGGFTMIEMLMVLLVTGILMGLAIPTIQRQIARNDLRAAGREIIEVLRQARDAAINEGVPRYVLFIPARDSYQQYTFNGTAWVVERNEGLLEDSVRFDASDVTFPGLANTPVSGATVPADAAYFGTRGRYSSTKATYKITLHGSVNNQLELSVYSQTGAVVGL